MSVFEGVKGERVEAMPHMWHLGCRVRVGEKLLLTLFKELPPPSPTVLEALKSMLLSWLP